MIEAVREPPQDYTNDQPSKANTMKTKLYVIITGLLMATCISSNGQEIVSTFTSTSQSSDCSIMESSDGSLIIGSYRLNDNYMVFKLTPEGSPIDSITIPETATYEYIQLLEIPSMPDNFLAVLWQGHYGFISIKFILINADLMLVNEVGTSLQMDGSWSLYANPFLIAPNKDVIFRYVDMSGDIPVRHFVRHDIYGTFIDDIAATEIPPFTSFSLFTEEPLTYCCLCSHTTNGTIHSVNYILDGDLHLIDSIENAPVSPDITFAYETGGLIPFIQPGEASHLLKTHLTSSNQTAAAYIKYDNEGHPLAYHHFTEHPQATYRTPVIKDQSTMYSSYGNYEFGVSQHLIHLDGDLEIVWDFPIPCPSYDQNTIRSIKVLQNGNIAVGTSFYNSPSTSILQVFIIRDNYDSTPETTTTDCPFTFYPNPVKDNLTLRFDDGAEPKSVELYDLAGRLVGTKPNGLECIDMSAMPSGVYLLRITTKDGTSYHEKVLKE